MPATKPRTIYARDLELRAELDASIKAKRREANDEAKQLAELDKAILAFTREKAGKDKSIVRSGWRLSIVTKAKSVPWKQLFLAAMGRTAVAQAEGEAETYEKLEVEPVSPAAKAAA